MSGPFVYPAYSRAERIADGAIHALGVSLALAGGMTLILLAMGQRPAGLVTALVVYGAAVLFSFVASALYHMTPWEAARPVFRRIDHAAIYLKIAGTYTPLVALVGSAFAWSVLGLVWTLALAGAALRLFRPPRNAWVNTGLYLGLGWLSLLVIWPLAQLLPAGGTALILTGGLLYSAGTIFLNWQSLRFQNAIWHGFVLSASVCFFAAIAWGVAAAPGLLPVE